VRKSGVLGSALLALALAGCGSEPRSPHGTWTGDSDADTDADADGGPDGDAGPNPDRCGESCAIACLQGTGFYCDSGEGLCMLGPFGVCYAADCCDETCGSPCEPRRESDCDEN
jgi:hypothetical protein